MDSGTKVPRVQEAREAVGKAAFRLAVSPPGPRREALIGDVRSAADAYARAVHIQACHVYTVSDRRKNCGDNDFLCDDARDLHHG